MEDSDGYQCCLRCFGSGEIEVFRPNRYVRKPVAENVEQLGLDL